MAAGTLHEYTHPKAITKNTQEPVHHLIRILLFGFTEMSKYIHIYVDCKVINNFYLTIFSDLVFLSHTYFYQTRIVFL